MNHLHCRWGADQTAAPPSSARPQPIRRPRPCRRAKACTDRMGASPSAHRVARRATQRACIHCCAVLWPIPNSRPCTTRRGDVYRETRLTSSRSSGVGSGQLVSVLYRRAVRGLPSRRPSALWAWNAASQGGTNGRNPSRVRLVNSSISIGRVCRSANRHAHAHGLRSFRGLVDDKSRLTLMIMAPLPCNCPGILPPS
jgi:hypothetical protein